jgi:cytoskeletal protein RodZ
VPGVADSTAAGPTRLISTHIDDGQPWDAAPARPASTVLRRPPRGAGVGRRSLWLRYAGVAAIVAVLALGLVTGVELVAGKPLSALLGVHGSPGSGPSVSHLFGSSGKSTTTTTSTPSSTTTTGAPGTTTTGASGTTNTTVPGSVTSTTTAGGTATAGSSTSTTRPDGSTTTTTSPG